MNKKFAGLLCGLLAVMMLFCAAGCQLRDGGTDAAAGAEDLEAVAAKIGDELTVTYGEVADAYNGAVQQYASYGMEAPTAEADIESMQDYVIKDLVTAKMMEYQTKLMGVELDENGIKGVDADVEDEMAYWLDTFRAQAQSEGAADVEARAKEIFSEELKNAGLDMDADGYRDYIRGYIEADALSAALKEKVMGEVSVTDQEVQTYYDDLLEQQKEQYAATPGDYLEDEEAFEKLGGDPILVTPEGYVRVKTVTVSPVEEISADYATLQTDMTALEAEYGQLSLDPAKKDGARLSAIAKEYAEKKTEADALYETYIAAAREKANKAYDELVAGKSFGQVLASYGEDDVYTTYPIFASEGLLMQKGVASSTWDQKLVDAVGKLQKGEYTPVIQVDDMFYICQLVGDEPAETKPLSDVKDSISEQALSAKGETYWNEQLESWLNDTGIVTYYEDVYRSVGK